MKILQVIPAFVPAYGYGGALNVCYQQSIKLIERGHDITVATTDAYDEKRRISDLKEVIDGITIIRFRNISNSLAKKYSGYLPMRFFTWAKQNIRNFDVVYCHDTLTYQNLVISLFCKKYKIPYLIQPHGNLSEASMGSRHKTLKRIILWFFKKVFKNAHNIVALTRKERESISRIDPSLYYKTIIIPNGIDPNKINDADKVDLRTQYGIPESHTIIGFIGRIQHIKGIDLSLRILSLLKKKLPFTFLIIGPDEGEKKSLDRLIDNLGLAENIVFCGAVSGMQKANHIKTCDLFLFTSRSEGLPMSILEVAGYGIPQVVSTNCNTPQVAEYNCGYEFPLDQTASFVSGIYQIATNEALRGEMKRNATRMIQECFNMDTISHDLETQLMTTLIK